MHIGQLFVVGARGGSPNGEVTRQVRENGVGGVIWFLSTTEQTARQNAEWQVLAQAVSGVPLLISADLESGMGMRFTDAEWWPPAMAIAATGDASWAEELGRATARDALAIGVNHILAPVADVNIDPANPVINTRSFGEDPAAVARYVEAFIRGVQDEGALATAKHFPGHGDTHVDSHRALPVLDVTRERLERVELVPFRAAIAAGVASIMIGHLAVPAVDETPAPVRLAFENHYGTMADEIPSGGTMPATLSRRVIIDLLRRELGFRGLVITDAMDMGGLAAHFDPGEAAVRAIEAGEDQILFSPDTDAAIAAVREAVHTGRIAKTRIEEALERIIEAKRRVIAPPFRRHPPLVDGRAAQLAERSITLVRDTAGLLPLKTTNVAVVTAAPHGDSLEPALRALGLPHVDPENADVVLLLLAVRPKSGAGNLSVPAAARDVAARYAAKTVAVSFGSPYTLRELGDVSTFLCAWGVQPVLQHAAVRALRGEAPIEGKLPVRV
jgi:beta-N-acetylhexosaminidase